jgi:hypothetical protein
MPGWMRGAAVIVLIGGPVLLYQLLPVVGLSAAAAASVAAIVALKHAGLLAVLLAPVYALWRRSTERRGRRE